MKRLQLFLVLFTLILSSLLGAETEYLKPEEALKQIFHTSEKITFEKKILTPELKEKIKGTSIERTEWNFYIATTGGKIDGYAVIDHEIGRLEPITYLVAIEPNGLVRAVEVLVYRESIGSEIHDKKFLKQYQNKNSSSPLRIGQDIQNISGATMSARAITQGVKRDLLVWQQFYGGKNP